MKMIKNSLFYYDLPNDIVTDLATFINQDGDWQDED